MQSTYPGFSLGHLCRLLGISRQAYYQDNKRKSALKPVHNLVLQQVHQIRANHPCLGGRKLYRLLSPFLEEHKIKMGRDALFNLLASHNLLIRRSRKVRTTNSYHRYAKWSNLIDDFIPTGINQLWVSDITYYRVRQNFVYISLITDAYSHKIVGYHVANNLKVIQSIRALSMALETLRGVPYDLIHHSDRGIQYCSDAYVNLLQNHSIKISMTQSGDPRENAIAERVNGILKLEYLKACQVRGLKEARQAVGKAIDLYNNHRPHMSIGMQPPNRIHNHQHINPQKLWKNYY